MNKLKADKQIGVVSALVEGNSIRATCRMTHVAKNTVVKLLHDLGHGCMEYQGRTLRDLPCKRIQCDEIWSFVGMKQKTADHLGRTDAGDAWTWTALCADTKLVPCWWVGTREPETAMLFIQDLAGRLSNRVQLTTDGLKMYLTAVSAGFGVDVDYAMLVKLYGNDPDGEKRYSPAICNGCEKTKVIGNPDPAHISTSFVERQNLTMRMGMRRFTRLTNAFSKKWENLTCAVALHFMHYNFARPHQTLTKNADGIRTTPAMAVGISDHVWGLDEIVGLLSN